MLAASLSWRMMRGVRAETICLQDTMMTLTLFSGHSVTDRSSHTTEVWAGTVAAILSRERRVGNRAWACSILITAALQSAADV